MRARSAQFFWYGISAVLFLQALTSFLSLPNDGDRALHESTTFFSSSSSPSIQRNSGQLVPHKKRKKRPRMVIHVGPGKTASTFLQCSILSNLAETEPILLRDNFVYMGTQWNACKIPVDRQKFLRHKYSAFFVHKRSSVPVIPFSGPVEPGTPLRPLNDDFVRRIQGLYRQGRNALIIYENAYELDNLEIAALSILLKHWDVEIVVGYRRLYRWLLSQYNQMNKPGRYVTKHPEYEAWPGETFLNEEGYEFLPFHVKNRTHWKWSARVDAIAHYNQHPSHTIVHNYGLYFDNITVMDIEHPVADDTMPGKPLAQHFFCRILGTEQACRAAQEGVFAAEETNPSVNLDYDLLAVAAVKAGLLDRAVPRRLARSMVQLWHEQRLQHNATTAFPLTCLPQSTMDTVLTLSLDVERSLFGAERAQEMEQEHRAAFLADHDKFCHVDVDPVLLDTSWRQFFDALSHLYTNSPKLQQDVQRFSPVNEFTEQQFDVVLQLAFESLEQSLAVRTSR